MSKFAVYSGRLVDAENITMDDIDIEDIAHNLSKIQRFNGGVPSDITYSVGEHCINLHNAIKDRIIHGNSAILYALMHDATEAYVGDLITPIKKLLLSYRQFEDTLGRTIREKYIPPFSRATFECIESYDKRILIDEVETIMPQHLELYQNETDLTKLGCNIHYNNHPSTVKQCFLTLFKQLTVEQQHD